MVILNRLHKCGGSASYNRVNNTETGSLSTKRRPKVSTLEQRPGVSILLFLPDEAAGKRLRPWPHCLLFLPQREPSVQELSCLLMAHGRHNFMWVKRCCGAL